ncbi:unnamed protein product [Vitrella brassicaformis CCMP3155]|uniref:Uncharacterized protein n=1 Tax=Vitrella brassicaformis (strain CCMP3155) TaxID=1169540 RepID=A0A0G4FLT0_VITBC|nr:unnamed protein product [Vitrella brassicaformis CCMP3155]|eukprot:CEM14876.1 unnamed protein product [Vitrella brassicaformis CCMP3155]
MGNVRSRSADRAWPSFRGQCLDFIHREDQRDLLYTLRDLGSIRAAAPFLIDTPPGLLSGRLRRALHAKRLDDGTRLDTVVSFGDPHSGLEAAEELKCLWLVEHQRWDEAADALRFASQCRFCQLPAIITREDLQRHRTKQVDAFYLGGLKTPDGKHEMERYYKVQQMERIVDVNALQVTFQGGDILEIFSDGSGFARLLTPNTKGGEKGCGEKGMASENGKYCIIGFIRLHDDVDAAGADDASKNKEGARLRKLPASSRLAAPGQSAYNTGPKGIGNNLFVNSGKAYQGDVFKINRDLFFGLGQLENHGSRVFG